MNDSHEWLRGFAVRGVFWRKYLDWAIINLPFYFHPLFVCFWTIFFFFFAAPARKAALRHLAIILPGSSRLLNYFRTFRTFYNFAWTLTEAANYKLLKQRFFYEVKGADFLDGLAAGKGAIILTAHMGNYDLGAALFAERFEREIHMVRAPEPDRRTAEHVDLSLEKTGGGAVKVDYSTDGASLSFDLLSALRNGNIISIQGDRVAGEIAHSPVTLFGKKALLPTGPFVLSHVSQTPIYPLFVTRSGYRRYGIIAREPIICSGNNRSRDDQIDSAMQKWCQVLEETIAKNWHQWYAFTPIFNA